MPGLSHSRRLPALRRLGGPRAARAAALCLLLVGATALHVPSAHAALETGGQAVVITTEGDTLTLRAGPGREQPPLAAFAAGTLLTVLDGPVPGADGALWYQVEGLGLTGWCVAEFLAAPGAAPSAPAADPSPATSASGASGVPVRRTMHIGDTDGKGARLRDAPRLSGGIILVIPEGETVIVAGAPSTADGYEWTPVEYGAAGGWVASISLSASSLPVPGAAVPPKRTPVPAPADTPATPSPAATPVPTPAPTATNPPAGAGQVAVGEQATVATTEGYQLRIRGGAGREAPILGMAPQGARVLVTGGPRQDGAGALWYEVDYDGLHGWALGDYLARAGAAEGRQGTAAPASSPQPAPPPSPATTTAPAQAAQPAATPSSVPPPSPASSAPATAAAAATTDRGQAVAHEALKYLGAKYVYGGTTPAGWDCSGLVQYVYQQVTGITLPRSTMQQSLVGAPVRSEEIRAGDIVLFVDTAGPGISHDGIALGDGRFVHAAGERSGTIISNLNDIYWSTHFAGARRP